MKNLSNFKISDFNILYDNVLVKSITIKEKNGVIVPTTYETKPEFGEVVAVGEGKLIENGNRVPLTVKVKDIVYFNKYSTTKFNFDGTDYYLVREEDIVSYMR